MPATWQSSIVSITDRAAWSAAHPDQSFFEERPEYPTLKWQEALVNAVVHRDYATQGQSVEVWLYSDRLEISSPGAPPDGVSLDDLNEGRPAHVTRNPRIARVLADLEIMRDQGEGIRRMFEEMLESYLSPPALDLDHGRFRVVLRKEPIAAYDELRAGGWVEMERARGVYVAGTPAPAVATPGGRAARDAGLRPRRRPGPRAAARPPAGPVAAARRGARATHAASS